MIRIAQDADAAAIHAIYAPTVTDSAITFETELPGEAVMRQRVQQRLQHYPWLVWEQQGQVLGYAYASRYRERAAYDWIAETSVYVHPQARRQGIAGRLYQRLMAAMALQGINQAVGVITLPGEVSVAMHERLGFAPAGVWKQSGYKLGRWWDVGVWQKQLQPVLNPPPPVTPFAQLIGTTALQQVLADGA